MGSQILFLGTGWDFPPHFSKTIQSVQMVSDAEDIDSSLEILFATDIGERIMQPSYGCNLKRLLFEPLDTGLQAYMKNMISTAILYHEPRIVLDKLDLMTKPEEGKIEIMLEYTVRSTNSRYNFVYPFYLNEGTNL